MSHFAEKVRQPGLVLLAVIPLFLFAGPKFALAEIVVDTGPGPDAFPGTIVSDYQKLAVEIDLDDAYYVNSLETWMYDYYARLGFVLNTTYSIAIYDDGGDIPGIELYSGDFVVANGDPDWKGISGVSWFLPAGQYWMSIELRVSNGSFGVVATPSQNPLPNSASYNSGVSDTWLNAVNPPPPYAPSPIELGARILGTPVSLTGLYQVNATGTSQSSPGGGSVTTSDWSLVFDDMSGDGLLHVDEIVSFSGATVDVVGSVPASYTYDAIVGAPSINGISAASGGFADCCWWFTGPVTAGPEDGWFPSRWTYTIGTFDTPEGILEELVLIVDDIVLLGGVGNALTAKLQNALADLEQGVATDAASAKGKIRAFVNQVNAQRGKSIDNEQADELIGLALALLALL